MTKLIFHNSHIVVHSYLVVPQFFQAHLHVNVEIKLPETETFLLNL